MKTCGGCYAGIVIMNWNEIERCDECALFETDDDAIAAVTTFLRALDREYRGRRSSDTVADAFDRLIPRGSHRAARKLGRG